MPLPAEILHRPEKTWITAGEIGARDGLSCVCKYRDFPLETPARTGGGPGAARPAGTAPT